MREEGCALKGGSWGRWWWGGVWGVTAGGQGHDDDEFEVRFLLNETANV